MDSRPLGDSGLTVSRLSLGSWRTFERISRDAGLEVMKADGYAGLTINLRDHGRAHHSAGPGRDVRVDRGGRFAGHHDLSICIAWSSAVEFGCGVVRRERDGR
jgi:hypothetical protein